MEGEGFEPSKTYVNGFTARPHWPLGHPSKASHAHTRNKKKQHETNLDSLSEQPASWSWRWDLNPQPADYKSAALPIELRQRRLLSLPIRLKTSPTFERSIRNFLQNAVG